MTNFAMVAPTLTKAETDNWLPYRLCFNFRSGAVKNKYARLFSSHK
jgi:hypothetical protein